MTQQQEEEPGGAEDHQLNDAKMTQNVVGQFWHSLKATTPVMQVTARCDQNTNQSAGVSM